MNTTRARMLFDSDRQIARTRCRSLVRPDRAILFKTGEMSVDIVLQRLAEDQVYLHGLIAPSSRDLPASGVRVSLVGAPEVAITDDYGQFSLAGGREADGFEIRIDLGEHELLCGIPAPIGSGEEDA